VFSQRTAWPRSENALTKATDALKVEAGAALVDLTASNPTAVGLEYDAHLLCDALAHPETLSYRPKPFGLEDARAAISRYYERRNVHVPPERILIVATTSEAYTFLFRLLANPGDTIAVPRPSYPLFSFLADLADVQLSPYHLRHGDREGWSLDFDSLEEAVDPLTRAVITVTPNNPTGSCLSQRERESLLEIAARGEIAVLSDEVFLDYLEDPRSFCDSTFAETKKALTFTMSGISKVAGLPQMKLSWVVVGGPDELVQEAISRLEIIADTFLSVSTPVMRALPEILEAAEPWQDKLRARLETNRRALAPMLTGTSCSVRKRHGGWYAMFDVPDRMDDEEWALEILEKEKVLIHPGYLFDVEEPAVLVASLIVEPEVFAEGMRRVLRCTNAAQVG
jgi:alanine-synthesizing transaminase